MFPYTFDQKLRENDTREDVPMKGFKALFQKKVPYKNKNLTTGAYRDGHGGVTLGITSSSEGRHWDLVLHNPKDVKRYTLRRRAQTNPETVDEDLEMLKNGTKSSCQNLVKMQMMT